MQVAPKNGALIILSSSRSPASSGQLSTSPWPLDRSKDGLFESTHQSGKGIRVDPGVGAVMTWTEALLADEVINLRLSSGHGLVDSWAEEAGDREEDRIINAHFSERLPSLVDVRGAPSEA